MDGVTLNFLELNMDGVTLNFLELNLSCI